MPTVPNSRIYHRSLDLETQDSLAKLAGLVQAGSCVLDLGAGPGILGRYLTEQLGCVVDGVEYNAAAVAEAMPWYRQLECADLEQIVLADRFAGQCYDFIVCADILEHLRQPDDLLGQLLDLLVPGGRILISVPNVAHAGLIAELLAGEFRYRPEGLLDQTHLRFFTLRSLLRLLETAGLRAVAVDATIRPLHESEFADHYLDGFSPALIRGLLGRPDALVYQFIVSAQRIVEVSDIDLPLLQCPPPELRFACQLFWCLPQIGYQAEHNRIAWGQIGIERQVLSLAIPELSVPPSALRLDCADRPGLVRLYGLILFDNEGRLLWQWDGQRESLANQPSRQLAIAAPGLSTEGVILLLAGDDPQLELPIPVAALAELRLGGELRVEISWPMSLDYLALVQHCIPRRDAETAQAVLARRVQEQEMSHALLTARNAELETHAATLTAQIAQLNEELTTQTSHQTALTSQLAQLQAKTDQQRGEIAILRQTWPERLRAKLRPYRFG